MLLTKVETRSSRSARIYRAARQPRTDAGMDHGLHVPPRGDAVCWSCPARRKSTGEFSERFAAGRPFKHAAACDAGRQDWAQASRKPVSFSRTDAKPLEGARGMQGFRSQPEAYSSSSGAKYFSRSTRGSRTPIRDPATQPAALMASDQTNGSSSRKLRVP